MLEEENLYFAAVGDVHGHIYRMLGLLQNWEKKTGKSLSFVLQVGDFEAHRHEEDLKTMDAPTKYKQLGDFTDFYEGRARFPYPLYFIGGNHESYGFLDQHIKGKEIAPNFNYLGRVNAIKLAGLKIVGVSGVYKADLFSQLPRPTVAEFRNHSNKEYIGFLESEIEQAIDYENTDVLLLHDWPRGIISAEALEKFKQRYSNADYNSIGNEYARLLIEILQPKLVLCGHLHFKYRYVFNSSSQLVSNICCLANVKQGQDSLAVFRIAPDLKITEIN